jgi:hypothetical protein
MANKKILVSSGNGKRQTIPTLSGTSSLYFDDATNTIVAKSGSISTLQVGTTSSMLVASSGVVSAIPVGTSGSMLVYNGSSWTTTPSTIPVGAAGGDLTGSYPTPQVKGVGNVVSGTLAIANGGTGRTTLTSGSILVGNSSQVGLIAPNANGDVLTVSSGVWGSVTGLVAIDIQMFTGSGAATWTKPTGARFARVLLQGAGGGGGSGWTRTATSQTVAGGAGGGSGGFTDIMISVIDLSSSATIPVYVGQGGAGNVSIFGGATAGGAGEQSRFGVNDANSAPSASNAKYYCSAGGGSGGSSSSTAAAGGAGGFGLTILGSAGATSTAGGGATTDATSSYFGATGGGAGGGVTTTGTGAFGSKGGTILEPINTIGGNDGPGASNAAGTSGGTGNSVNSYFGFLSAIGLKFGTGGGGGGGSGGASSTFGGSGGTGGNYGGGGGGGGSGYFNTQSGGNGSKGFVIVISYA